MYKVYSGIIKREDYYNLYGGRTISMTFSKPKFQFMAEIKSEYSITETCYIRLFSDNEDLIELSKVYDPLAKEFFEKLAEEAKESIKEAVRVEREKEAESEHSKAIALIEKLI